MLNFQYHMTARVECEDVMYTAEHIVVAELVESKLFCHIALSATHTLNDHGEDGSTRLMALETSGVFVGGRRRWDLGDWTT